jgi:hypothetical protein
MFPPPTSSMAAASSRRSSQGLKSTAGISGDTAPLQRAYECFLARPLHRAALNRTVGGLTVWPEVEFVVGAIQVLVFAMSHVPELSPAGPGERV